MEAHTYFEHLHHEGDQEEITTLTVVDVRIQLIHEKGGPIEAETKTWPVGIEPRH